MDSLTPIIKAVDEEEQISIEVVYVPYRLDSDKQWMRPETIRKACENFNENLAKGNIKSNLFHSKDDNGNYTSTDKFEIIKSWINETDAVIGDQHVPEGTWICKLKWKDSDAWEKRKAGVLMGVSIGANGTIKRPNEDDS